MNNNRKLILKQISELFESQSFLVLSTQQNNQPYSSLIAFVASSDLECIYFMTPNNTHKYENLKANPKVSILVNNSRNQADDIYNAISVTGIGVASIVDKTEEMNVLEMYLKKHPHLKEFSSAPTTAFICITIKQYFMVNRFQNVVEIKVKQ